MSCEAATPGCAWNARDRSSSAPGVRPMASPVRAGAMGLAIGVASSARGISARACVCICRRYGMSAMTAHAGPFSTTADGVDSAKPATDAASA